MTDNRIAAQNGSAGINGYIVFNRGVPFDTAQFLASPGRKSADGDTLIDFYIFPDDGGFADYDAGAVVDEEIPTDGGAGVNIDPRFPWAYSVMMRGSKGTFSS